MAFRNQMVRYSSENWSISPTLGGFRASLWGDCVLLPVPPVHLVTYRSEKHWTGAKKELRGNKAKRKYTQQYFKERSQSLSSCRRLVWAAWRLYQTIVFPMAHLSSEVIKALAGMALWKLRKWKLYLFTLDSMITYETDWSNLKPQLEKREWNQN